MDLAEARRDIDVEDTYVSDVQSVFAAQMARAISGLRAPKAQAAIVAATRYPALVAKGWSCAPQERNGARLPGRYFIRKGPTWVATERVKWKRLQTEMPSRDDVERWAHNVSDNLAVIMGSASGTMAVDIDITDPTMAAAIESIAERTLGVSPIKRVGRAPKSALIYRFESSGSDRNSSFKFDDGDGEPLKFDGAVQAVEFLLHGMLTAYGQHHKTGREFEYPRSSFVDVSPADLPVITAKDLARFKEAVAAEFKLLSGRSFAPQDFGPITPADTDHRGLQTPRGAESVREVEYRAGKVSDGRNVWLGVRVYAWVVCNQQIALSDKDRICRSVFAEAKQWLERSGRWADHSDGGSVWCMVEEAVRRCVHKLSKGQLGLPSSLRQFGQKAAFEKPASCDLSWMRPSENLRIVSQTGPDEAKAAERKLVDDERERASIHKRVSDQLDNAITGFLRSVSDRKAGKDVEIFAAELAAAPTGAGKTTKVIAALADLKKRGKLDFRLAMTMPTFENMKEAQDRILQLGGTDISPQTARNEVAKVTAVAEAAGLKVVTWKGKESSGCEFAEQMAALRSAGMSTADMCSKQPPRDKETGELPDPIRCPAFERCAYQKQKALAAEADLILLSDKYLSITVPRELTQLVDAIVIDERCWPLFVRTNYFPDAPTPFSAETLRSPRDEVRLTKAQIAEGLNAADLLIDRERVAEVAVAALAENKDVAEFVLDRFIGEAERRAKDAGQVFTAEMAAKAAQDAAERVKSAKEVCARGRYKADAVSPGMNMAAVEAAVSVPQGVNIGEEARFWTLVGERIEQLIADRAHAKLSEIGTELPTKQAKGDRDYRIQQLTENVGGVERRVIRISWRVEPSFGDIPTLLLDASAEPEIIRKIWSWAPVKVHKIDAPLHVRTVAAIDRTWSDSAFKVRAVESVSDKLQKAGHVVLARDVISSVAGAFAGGRVVIGSSQSVRKIVSGEAWVPPQNVDFTHFGAVRGLDFAKDHRAAISFGRMELPVRVVDAIVAALTYDDETPEQPVDRFGTGLNDAGKPVRCPIAQRSLRMRDGSDVVIKVPAYSGAWAAIVQRQYREEELRQFVGRLRPVYRKGDAPVWFCVTSCVPADIVVDAVCTMEELARPDANRNRIWEAVRRSNIIDPKMSVHADINTEKSLAGAIGRLTDGVCGEQWKLEFTVGSDDSKRQTMVAGYISDPVQALTDAVRAAGDEINEVRIVHEPIRGKDHGRARKPDKLDLVFGTREERAAREHLLRTALRGEAVPGAGGIGLSAKVGDQKADLDVRMALDLGGGVDGSLALSEVVKRAQEAVRNRVD